MNVFRRLLFLFFLLFCYIHTYAKSPRFILFTKVVNDTSFIKAYFLCRENRQLEIYDNDGFFGVEDTFKVCKSTIYLKHDTTFNKQIFKYEGVHYHKTSGENIIVKDVVVLSVFKSTKNEGIVFCWSPMSNRFLRLEYNIRRNTIKCLLDAAY